MTDELLTEVNVDFDDSEEVEVALLRSPSPFLEGTTNFCVAERPAKTT